MPAPEPRSAIRPARRPSHRRAAPRDPRAGPISAALDALSVLLAVLGVAQALRAPASGRFWMALGLSIPVARVAFERSYRRRVADWLRAAWIEAGRFASGAGPLPWRAALALVVVPFVLFDLATGKVLGSIDTRPVIPTAASLARQGDWDLREFDDPRGPDILHGRDGALLRCYQVVNGHIYSSFPSGMVPFALAVVGPARLLGADLDRRVVHVWLEKVAAALVAALALASYWLTASTLGRPGVALVSTWLLATGSALWTTAGLGLWQHGGVAVWLLLAMLVEFRGRGRPARAGCWLQALACAGMLTCRPTAALLVGAFGLWVFVRAPWRGLMLAARTGLLYLPWMFLYWNLYGDVLGPVSIRGNTSGGFWHFFDWPRVLGVYVIPARGLFVYQPWALLGVATLLVGARRLSDRANLAPGPAGWAAFCAGAAVAHAFLIASWYDWSGGFCWGSRLLTEIVPLWGVLSLPTLAWLVDRRWGRGVVSGVALVGFLIQAPLLWREADRWNYASDHDADLWSWPRAPFLFDGRKAAL
jgi:hypothetical protein